MTKILTVYRKHPCVKCDMTIRHGKQLGYDIVEDDLFNDKGELNTIPKTYKDMYDFKSSPIVVLTQDDKLVEVWSDFRIDKLNQYKQELKVR